MNFRRFVFSWQSKLFHTIWFSLWFLLHLGINSLTLIVSLEAIYLELFLGDQNNETDVDLDRHSKLIEEIHSHLKGGKK